VELDDLLNALDRTAANLGRLEDIWSRAAPFIPSGPSRGSPPEYDNLRRAWDDLLPGLPEIEGWTITDPLPDIDSLGQAFIDYLEISEVPFPVLEAGEKPGKDLEEYKYRLSKARRRAVTKRLNELTAVVDGLIHHILFGAPSRSTKRIGGEEVDAVKAAVKEIERLIGDSVVRQGRWEDLSRHLYFSEGHDWHDICEFDWPSVRPDIEGATLAATEPLPVPHIDLGQASAGNLTGKATVALPWERLDDEGFERLLYDLLLSIPEYENVQWLMSTHAPDRGRDISVTHVIRGSTGSVRHERVIVQAKHWLKKSVGPGDVSNTLAAIKLWQPPVVRGLIIATSGHFTGDGVSWIDMHNDKGDSPWIDPWPRSKLETLLAQKPSLAVAHGLR